MLTCLECGRENADDSRFCNSCGSALEASALPQESRRTVTVVFCDVTGSTAMGELLDPEAVRRLMGRYFDEMKAAVESHGGTVEKFIGDAVMAVFGIPHVHEDDALRAVRAAAEMRERLRELNKEFERDFGATMSSRIGVNTGEVVAGPTAQTLVTGDAVNVAARLEQGAKPGEILIGETTYRLVRDAVLAEHSEPLELKGKAEPVPAYRLRTVVGVEGVERRFDLPMVGRVEELRALRDSLRRVARDGICSLVTVLGPAGVGKSRLVQEFLEHEAVAGVVRGRCLPYGDGITYWPVIEMLTASAGIGDLDGPSEVQAKIAALLGQGRDDAVVVQRLAQLLGLSGSSATPEEIPWAMRKLFEALAVRSPLIVVFDDIHWGEAALLDLIEHVADWSREAPILLLCSARPEFLDERPAWGGGKLNAASFLLEPLTDAECDELIENLLERAPLPADAKRRITEAAEGNPLFLEQTVGMLIDDGLLVREGDRWIAEGDLAGVSVPASISALLQARLGGLPPAERSALERASVEGKVFHVGSVSALSSDIDRPRVRDHLMALVRRDLIRPDRSLFASDDAFRFRHALIRDAAYQQMPKERRAELHERYADWLGAISGDRAEEFEEILAYHLEKAYRLRSELGPLDDHTERLAEQASRRLTSGGRKAFARGDMTATSNLLARAVALLDPEEATRADLLVRLGDSLIEIGEIERAAVAIDEALASAERSGDRRVEIHARLSALALRAALAPEGVAQQAKDAAEAAIPVLEELGDDEGLARAWHALGDVANMWGRASEMERAFERAAAHAELAGDRAGLSDALGLVALALFLGMTPAQEGIRRCEALRARAPDDHRVEAWTSAVHGLFLAMLGHFDEGRAMHREAREIFADLGMTLTLAGTSAGTGMIEILAGDYPEAERAFREGYDVLASVGERGFLSTHAGQLGNVLYALGRFGEAEEMTRIAEAAAATDDLSSQLKWRQVRAKLLGRGGQLDEAVRLGEEAIALSHGADFHDIADVYVDLAEVYGLVGRTADAADALREGLAIYERKGNVVEIGRTQALIAELATPE